MVNQLIAAPDPKSMLFWRDVAILELLYASGLRATELCELKMRDLNLQVRLATLSPLVDRASRASARFAPSSAIAMRSRN